MNMYKQNQETRKIDFGKIVPDYHKRKGSSVSVEMCLDMTNPLKPVFTASGAITGNNGRGYAGLGQNLDTIMKYVDQLNDPVLFTRIFELWRKWHLNNLNAGTPEQAAYLHQYREENNLDGMSFKQQVEVLKEANLYEVKVNGNDYEYGCGWLYQAIDPADLEEIRQIIGIKVAEEMAV